MAQTLAAPGLTTGQAPFVEEARNRGDLYITQDYSLYSEENHEVWRKLYKRIRPRWEKYANPHFLHGLDVLNLPPDRIPRHTEINDRLRPLTGFQARAVSGYVPVFLFFDCLHRREFPTTITIRPPDQIDYIPEPDIFHDLAGHVPMHTDPAFANTLVRFGDCAHTARELTAGVRDQEERRRRLKNIVRALSRVFWFTVEFGLMRGPGGRPVAYGSGLLSSYGELQHAIESDEVQRSPAQLEWMIHQEASDEYQPLLFVVDSFDQLFDMVDRLERWMREGRLNHVAPGRSEIKDSDLEGFLNESYR